MQRNTEQHISLSLATVYILIFVTPLAHASDCPSTVCTCTVDLIDCRFKGGREKFTEVPRFVASDIGYKLLTLSGNDITAVNDDAFSGLKMDSLDLSNNRLWRFGNHSFRGITNLKQLILTLDLSALFPTYAMDDLALLVELQVRDYAWASLPSNAFTGLKNLKVLSVTPGELIELTPEVFGEHQDTIEKLDISSNKLRNVPTVALQKLTRLTNLLISKNSISVLGSNSFSDLQLGSLHMSSYSNLAVHVDAFVPLIRTLRNLTMSSCQLKNDHVTAFSKLRNLVMLDLSINQITNINGLFVGMASLEEADLAHNQITRLEKTTFDGAPSLRVLLLNDNILSQIHSDVFQPLTSLQRLNLDGAVGVTSLSNNSFISQTYSLKVLSIERSNATSKQWGIFSNLLALETLKASYCSLGDIPEFVFRRTTRLSMLSLNSNGIREIKPWSFAGLDTTRATIELIGNHIHQLDPCTFDTTRDTALQLYLQGNPLQCDCHIAWLYNWFVVKLKKKDLPWTCENGTEVADLPAEGFTQCVTLTTAAPCEDWRQMFTTPVPMSITLHVDSTSSHSMNVKWDVVGIPSEGLTGFVLWHYAVSDDIIASIPIKDASVRHYTIENLKPETDYKLCIATQSHVFNYSHCLDVSTGTTQPTSADNSVVLWSVVAGSAAAVILFLVILACCYSAARRRRQQRHTLAQRYMKPAGMPSDAPQLSEASKRFQRPKAPEDTLPVKAKSIADQLNCLSDDERYRLVNLLTNSGGSMASLHYVGAGYQLDQRSRTMPLDLGNGGGLQYHYSLERRRQPLESCNRHVYDEIEDEFYDEISVDEII